MLGGGGREEGLKHSNFQSKEGSPLGFDKNVISLLEYWIFFEKSKRPNVYFDPYVRAASNLGSQMACFSRIRFFQVLQPI